MLLFCGLTTLLVLATAIWGTSVLKKDASIVDNFWGLFFAILFAVYLYPLWQSGVALPKASYLMGAVLDLWVIRYTVYIYVRNHGQPEDSRYTDIRKNWDPGFWWKSLFIIFLFQAAIAWALSAPFYMVAQPAEPYALTLSYIGFALGLFGLVFEAVADYQLNKFKKVATKGAVMDKGLWRYSRHPNYFGQSCLWFGFAFVAIGHSGAWWVLYAPALMTWLLLKFSGVSLMEQTIVNRRPGYKDYMARTSAFIPMPPKK